jgi:hypothetical protein
MRLCLVRMVTAGIQTEDGVNDPDPSRCMVT